MATVPLSGSSKGAFTSFRGFLLPAGTRVSSSMGACSVGLGWRSFRGLVVRAATVVSPKRKDCSRLLDSTLGCKTMVNTKNRRGIDDLKEIQAFLLLPVRLSLRSRAASCEGKGVDESLIRYTSFKPLADRVLVKIKSSEETTTGGVLLPMTAQSKPQCGEVIVIGEGRTVGQNKVEIGIEAGSQVVYSRYAGTELEFNGSKHLLLKEDDIVGVLDTDDVKDLKPVNDRVLIKHVEWGGFLILEITGSWSENGRQRRRGEVFLRLLKHSTGKPVRREKIRALNHISSESIVDADNQPWSSCFGSGEVA
ncbi:20 kDa chaperonin, chloroplastic [Apostasia shenzhenica]|uniref:20 kDa chaperonin, chloroplastic n=1 Tax=Apostasia shenzhenica TaxID=1088818 RepID=A0A2I0B8A1_9ASPA|nr:20 kDa chaperonin, chloroplastic [Apostasia shenzhenica]